MLPVVCTTEGLSEPMICRESIAKRARAMRTDVLMEWSLKYSSPWQRRHQPNASSSSSSSRQAVEASVNMRTIY